MDLKKLAIDPSRVEFLPRQDRQAYLRTYHHIDLCLDTYPANGHTTNLDALWMGVPVVTMYGPTAISRGGLSITSNVGLPELACDNPDRFVQIAVSLANDLPRLAELRSTLRERIQKSPLMDAPRFARDMEAIYRTIWKDWCKASP